MNWHQPNDLLGGLSAAEFAYLALGCVLLALGMLVSFFNGWSY